MMAAEPLTPAEYAWQSDTLMRRLELVAANEAGALRMAAAFAEERADIRIRLLDLAEAHETTPAERNAS